MLILCLSTKSFPSLYLQMDYWKVHILLNAAFEVFNTSSSRSCTEQPQSQTGNQNEKNVWQLTCIACLRKKTPVGGHAWSEIGENEMQLGPHSHPKVTEMMNVFTRSTSWIGCDKPQDATVAHDGPGCSDMDKSENQLSESCQLNIITARKEMNHSQRKKETWTRWEIRILYNSNMKQTSPHCV